MKTPCPHKNQFLRVLSSCINIEVTQTSCSDCGEDIGSPKTEVS